MLFTLVHNLLVGFQLPYQKCLVFICHFQSFKRKPGQADNERSMGDHSEHVHKRLRTIESSSEAKQNTTQPEQNVEEADAFEHIKQGTESYDAQTYGMAVFTRLQRLTSDLKNEHCRIEGKAPII